jgi:hypothetical protein
LNILKFVQNNRESLTDLQPCRYRGFTNPRSGFRRVRWRPMRANPSSGWGGARSAVPVAKPCLASAFAAATPFANRPDLPLGSAKIRPSTEHAGRPAVKSADFIEASSTYA